MPRERVSENEADEGREEFEHYQALFSLTDEELHDSLLDVAAGRGGFIRYVREVLGNKDAFGVELSAEKVQTEDGDGMVVADGRRLPFADGTFRTVVAKEYVPMFLDTPDPMLPVRELLRVVSPGGRVLFHNVTRAFYGNPEEMTSIGRRKVKKRISGLEQLAAGLDELRGRGYFVTVEEPNPKQAVVTIVKP